MQSDDIPTFRVWDGSNNVSQPMELPPLVTLVKQKKIGPAAWIYREHARDWVQAGSEPSLKSLFSRPRPADAEPGAPERGVSLPPGVLRRLKLFAGLEDSQIEACLGAAELLRFKQFDLVVGKGEHGNAMYLILEGELRARIMVEGKEVILATMETGDFFGEISLLDHGPRSADVLANSESLLLKISSAGIEALVQRSPEVAAPLLLGLSKTVVNRVRKLTKHYQDSLLFARARQTS